MFQAEVWKSGHAFVSKLCYREVANTTGPLWQGFLCQTLYLQEREQFCETFADTGPDLGALFQARYHSHLVPRSPGMWAFKPKLGGNASTQAFDLSPVTCPNPCAAGDHGTVSSGVVSKQEHLGFRETNSWLQRMEKLSCIACFACGSKRRTFLLKTKKLSSWDRPILFWLSGSFSRSFFSEKCPRFVFATSWYIGTTLGWCSLNNCNSRIYFSFFWSPRIKA